MNRAYDPLLSWYRLAKRDLPWRLEQPDPYKTWVSEIMLQQTGVSTVIPYFERWMERFPTVESLAQAEEADVLSLWQGLGYYRRARNLLAGARFVAEKKPRSVADWVGLPLRAIPGVGRYTAGAIASIALGQAEPLVDGNVERVFARLTGERAAKPTVQAWAWAEKEIRSSAPGDWNQALMELGATVCTPRNPNCLACPLQEPCVARGLGIQNELPTSSPKAVKVALTFDVWIVAVNETIGMVQQPAGGWWHGLWTSPFAAATKESQSPFGESVSLGTLKHVVTNHLISFRLNKVRVSEATEGLTFFKVEDLDALPLPAWQRKALDRFWNSENSELSF